jgi:hypothetical protein
MQASRYDRVAGTGQGLHAALDDYIAHLASQESPDDSGWFRTQGNQAGRFKAHHADTDLGKIGLAEMQKMFDTWRLRKAKAERTGRAMLLVAMKLKDCLEANLLLPAEPMKTKKPMLICFRRSIAHSSAATVSGHRRNSPYTPVFGRIRLIQESCGLLAM